MCIGPNEKSASVGFIIFGIFQLNPGVRLLINTVTVEFLQLVLIQIVRGTFGVDQRLVKVENQQFSEAWFLKLEVYFLRVRDFREGLDLLNEINAMKNSMGHLFVGGNTQRFSAHLIVVKFGTALSSFLGKIWA